MNKKLQQLFKIIAIKSPSLREGFRMGFILFLSLGISTTIFAQTVQSNFINYQGVASDASGTVMAEQSITVGIALIDAGTGTVGYAENHSVTTDANGVFSLQIGNGTGSTTDYDTFIRNGIASSVTVSINGTEIGTTELLAVPYAIRAGNGDGARKIDDLSDAKSDNNGSSIFLGIDAGANDVRINGRNVGIGFQALAANTTGSNNTVIGYLILAANTTGSNNTANGFQTLAANTTGSNNTANGFQTLAANTIGSKNTANGNSTLSSNITGNFNTANGNDALFSNTSGNYNTAIGSQALWNLTAGNNNTAIGYDAVVPNLTGSNQIRIGNSDVTYAGVQVAWTITSDAAWKDDIQPLPYGLNLVSQLKPVDYVRKNNKANTREIGFIAQDVELLLNKLGYTNTGMLTTADDGRLSLRYNDFIPVLTKAVQELHDKTNSLEKMNKELIKRIEVLENK